MAPTRSARRGRASLLLALASLALAACLPSPPTPTPAPIRPSGDVPKSVVEAAPTPPSGPAGVYPGPAPGATVTPLPMATLPAYVPPGK